MGLGPEETETITRTFDVQSAATLQLKGSVGSVTVKSWDKDQVEMVATKRTRFGRQALGNVTVETTHGSDKVAVAQKNSGLMGYVSVDYDLKVPAGMTLADVEVTTGSVDVSGITGDALLRTTTGSIALADVKGGADLTTTTGSIKATNLGGSLKAHLTTGSLEARNVGRIEKLHATTGSIDTTVNAITPDTHISTTTGGITLRLAPDFGALLDASTTTGGIHHEQVPVTSTTTGNGNRLTGQIGQGSDKLRVETTTGSIHLLRQ